jgi:hypothetical protein
MQTTQSSRTVTVCDGSTNQLVNKVYFSHPSSSPGEEGQGPIIGFLNTTIYEHFLFKKDLIN